MIGRLGSPLTGMVPLLGDSGREDVQVAGRLRVDYPALAVDYQEDLDERTTLGRIHRLCEGDRAGQLDRKSVV